MATPPQGITSEVLHALEALGRAGTPVYAWRKAGGVLEIYTPSGSPLRYPLTPAPQPEPEANTPDDLTAISGVGPAAAAKLRTAGLDSFAILARADYAALVDAVGAPTANKISTYFKEHAL